MNSLAPSHAADDENRNSLLKSLRGYLLPTDEGGRKSKETWKLIEPLLTKVLDEFYQKRIPVFGFISFTKSKDIVNIIKNGILLSIIPDLSYDYLHSSLDNNLAEKNLLDNVVDSDLMDHILKPFCRSNIFLSNTKILNYYPDHLKINFCYINIESEIIRVEFPSWLSQDLEYLDSLLKTGEVKSIELIRLLKSEQYRF